jgi:hypothetical protein
MEHEAAPGVGRFRPSCNEIIAGRPIAFGSTAVETGNGGLTAPL